ncbi:60S ribosomal protein L38 [Zea mays]|uniref:60S ribosomal protein L38 n=1 Tax=Zea mays TaxID=4577 RepID=B4FJT8_MAIZE|nr:unknown [Zea mays]ACF83682.1 unknown [Zea mays]ONM03515.1 60S ribosomal protein L38 [Zea mays]
MATSGRTSRASLSLAEHAVYVVLDLKLLDMSVLDLWILNFWRNTNLPRSRTHLSVFSYLTACSPSQLSSANLLDFCGFICIPCG